MHLRNRGKVMCMTIRIAYGHWMYIYDDDTSIPPMPRRRGQVTRRPRRLIKLKDIKEPFGVLFFHIKPSPEPKAKILF